MSEVRKALELMKRVETVEDAPARRMALELGALACDRGEAAARRAQNPEEVCDGGGGDPAMAGPSPRVRGRGGPRLGVGRTNQPFVAPCQGAGAGEAVKCYFVFVSAEGVEMTIYTFPAFMLRVSKSPFVCMDTGGVRDARAQLRQVLPDYNLAAAALAYKLLQVPYRAMRGWTRARRGAAGARMPTRPVPGRPSTRYDKVDWQQIPQEQTPRRLRRIWSLLGELHGPLYHVR